MARPPSPPLFAGTLRPPLLPLAPSFAVQPTGGSLPYERPTKLPSHPSQARYPLIPGGPLLLVVPPPSWWQPTI